MKHDKTVAMGGSFFGGKTMSDEEKTVTETDFAQKITEAGETAEEKEKRIFKEKQKRVCIIVVLIVSALIFSGFVDGMVSRYMLKHNEQAQKLLAQYSHVPDLRIDRVIYISDESLGFFSPLVSYRGEISLYSDMMETFVQTEATDERTRNQLLLIMRNTYSLIYKTDKIFDLAKPEYFWIYANVYTEELTIKTKGGHTFYYHIDGYWEPESLKIDDRVIYESNDD